jgi:signal peptidase I
MSSLKITERKPWAARTLSMLCCGLGQIYCGQAGRGLIFYSSLLLLGPVIVLSAMSTGSTLMLVLFLAGLAASIGISLWSIVDAGRLARSAECRDYELREYNRTSVYALLIAKGVMYALVIAFFVRANAVEAFVIPSSSMSPTFLPGDRILTNKLGMADRTLWHGDVVVFRNPVNRRQTYIKRVIGLPGETVEIRGGEIFINGQPAARQASPTLQPDAGDTESRYIETLDDRRYEILQETSDQQSMAPMTVPPWTYFLLGDRRSQSKDSREFGPVAHSEILGVVNWIYWPAQSWGRFGAPEPSR